MNDDKIIYLCDPDKNKECEKTVCQYLCNYTVHKEYAVLNAKGEPVLMSDEERRQRARDYQRLKREENKENIEWQLRQAKWRLKYYNRKIEKLRAKLQQEQEGDKKSD